MSADLHLRLLMWQSLKEWKQLSEVWIEGKFLEINTEEIKRKADAFQKIVGKCMKGLPQNPILEELK